MLRRPRVLTCGSLLPDMAAGSVQDTPLFEYLQETNNGDYCKLMGWSYNSSFTNTLSSTSSGSTLEAWYLQTEPSPPASLVLPTSSLTWRPYRVLETIPHGQPLGTPRQSGSLRCHREIGWHYAYLQPFKITGKPYHRSSVKPCSTPSQSSMKLSGLGEVMSPRDPGHLGSQVKDQVGTLNLKSQVSSVA